MFGSDSFINHHMNFPLQQIYSFFVIMPPNLSVSACSLMMF